MQVFKTPFRKNKLLTKLNRIFNPPPKTKLAEEINRKKLKRIKDTLIVSQKIEPQLDFPKMEHQEIRLNGFTENENLRLNEILRES